MRKQIGSVLFCFILCAAFWMMDILSDQQFLSHEVIRMHVVANSDSEKDQSIKLLVRDAVCASMEEDLRSIRDLEQAKAYIEDAVPRIKQIAEQVLQRNGIEMETSVSFCKEAFPVRLYDTFRLPAGIYDTLRITIGEGEGQNWWCVTFPSLCAQSDFQAAAAGAGFDEKLTNTLRTESGYDIRFYFMDVLGGLAARINPQ